MIISLQGRGLRSTGSLACIIILATRDAVVLVVTLSFPYSESALVSVADEFGENSRYNQSFPYKQNSTLSMDVLLFYQILKSKMVVIRPEFQIAQSFN